MPGKMPPVNATPKQTAISSESHILTNGVRVNVSVRFIGSETSVGKSERACAVGNSCHVAIQRLHSVQTSNR